MRFVLDLLYLLAGIAYSPVVIYRAIRHKRYRTGWGQRFGRVSRRSPEKKCIWIHAVSVGEINAAKTIIRELENRFGDFEIVVSTTTDTGFARARSLFSDKHEVFYFPFDFSLVVCRAFMNIRPAICLLMELEVWPNFVSIAKRLGIPVIVVNGRISDKSFSGYKKIRPFVKGVFGKVTLVLAQTDEYAKRFREIGAAAERVVVTGSLKYDTAQITDKVEGTDALAEQLNIGSERLWVAGATGPGEEKIILDVFTQLAQADQFKDLRLVIVPRKPERFDEVAQAIVDAGFKSIRYSLLKNAESAHPGKEQVILGDTMGDLRKFYCLATAIFIGRSLVPMGGSDMMEAAALGKCTIFGPHAFNFRQTVDALLADGGAILVKDRQELLQTMRKCLLEPDFARSIAENGREVIRKNQGATAGSIEQIGKFLSTTR
ncbi:MAG: 3-deoxy-D-manno-octulosonic acid transferase [Planctomycetota bacterium]|jgi:3-deoxy-D-manno-octulosonic-acid transferase